MDIVVTYDVSTEDKAGRRRLRRVAKLCEDYGQRVQYSVFECTVTAMQLDAMMTKMAKEINVTTDSLRVYRLHGGRTKAVKVLGRDKYTDFSDVLLL
ncbi:MAG: CRISPR-associated endonuclease Cas2 [Mariprofundales bacterium]